MTTASINCPVCETGAVPSPQWAFSDTSVEVPACFDCFSRTGVLSVRVKVSRVMELSIDSAVSEAMRHNTGLVWVGGAK